MNDEGRERLIEALKDSLELAESNPCRASDASLKTLSDAVRVFLNSEINTDLSREQTARFLGMSTRTLGRRVEEGKVPKPKRKGHKALSFSALSLVKWISKIRRETKDERR